MVFLPVLAGSEKKQQILYWPVLAGLGVKQLIVLHDGSGGNDCVIDGCV